MNYSGNKVSKIILSLPEATEKIKHWCAYQERSHFETQHKLYSYGLSASEIESAIAELISENFLNEERFAQSFARGKFRIKHWGKNKIKNELKFRRVSAYSINKAIKQIEDDEYLQVIKLVIERKTRLLKEKNELKKRFKIITYLISRGFERDLVNDVLNTNLEDN